MKFGVVGSSGTARENVELAVAAEAAGWDGFFTWDGLTVGPVDTFDPWTLLGAVAVRTERITLGAMIFPLARRSPWKVVRESVTVDHLSGGRLVLPVGLGAAEHDGGFARVPGVPRTRRDRAEALDELLGVLAEAWTGEPVTHHGRWFSGEDLVFRPRPVRGRIPIWAVTVAGAPRSLARGARHDGALVAGAVPEAPIRPEDVAVIAAWTGEHRSSTEPFEIVTEGVLPDDPQQAQDLLAGLAEAGATWWIESRWEGEKATYPALLELVRQGPPAVPNVTS